MAETVGPCWLWQGTIRTTDGYGQITLKGRHTLAHRTMYEALFGPIPDGLEPDHVCRVHACVNPFHLELIDHRGNVLRGASPAAVNARKTHCPRGHPYTAENIRSGGPNGTHRYCRRCQAEVHDLRRKERRQAARG